MKNFRGYYRCTHRNTQGCLATKQVQRSDDNAMVFDVTYNGVHTCQQKNTKPNSNMLIAKKEPEQTREQDLTKPFQPEIKLKTDEGFNSALMQFPVPSFLNGLSEANLFSTFDISEYGVLSEWIPMACSGTSSPVLEMDFGIENLEFDPNFSMDASCFFT
jgi:WRKY DNA -binding domain